MGKLDASDLSPVSQFPTDYILQKLPTSAEHESKPLATPPLEYAKVILEYEGASKGEIEKARSTLEDFVRRRLMITDRDAASAAARQLFVPEQRSWLRRLSNRRDNQDGPDSPWLREIINAALTVTQGERKSAYYVSEALTQALRERRQEKLLQQLENSPLGWEHGGQLDQLYLHNIDNDIAAAFALSEDELTKALQDRLQRYIIPEREGEARYPFNSETGRSKLREFFVRRAIANPDLYRHCLQAVDFSVLSAESYMGLEELVLLRQELRSRYKIAQANGDGKTEDDRDEKLGSTLLRSAAGDHSLLDTLFAQFNSRASESQDVARRPLEAALIANRLIHENLDYLTHNVTAYPVLRQLTEYASRQTQRHPVLEAYALLAGQGSESLLLAQTELARLVLPDLQHMGQDQSVLNSLQAVLTNPQSPRRNTYDLQYWPPAERIAFMGRYYPEILTFSLRQLHDQDLAAYHQFLDRVGYWNSDVCALTTLHTVDDYRRQTEGEISLEQFIDAAPAIRFFLEMFGSSLSPEQQDELVDKANSLQPDGNWNVMSAAALVIREVPEFVFRQLEALRNQDPRVAEYIILQFETIGFVIGRTVDAMGRRFGLEGRPTEYFNNHAASNFARGLFFVNLLLEQYRPLHQSGGLHDSRSGRYQQLLWHNTLMYEGERQRLGRDAAGDQITMFLDRAIQSETDLRDMTLAELMPQLGAETFFNVPRCRLILEHLLARERRDLIVQFLFGIYEQYRRDFVHTKFVAIHRLTHGREPTFSRHLQDIRMDSMTLLHWVSQDPRFITLAEQAEREYWRVESLMLTSGELPADAA